MNNVQIGSLVTSKQGRDKDKIYMVLGFQGDRALLADGKIRTVKKPKLKNIKHIKPINQGEHMNTIEQINDEKIAHSLSTFEQKDN